MVTWTYREGNAASLFGFTARPMDTSPMDTSMVVPVFYVAFGPSMDHEVLVTSRIKEPHDLGADHESAVADGPGRTGRVVSAAALVLAVSCFASGTSRISFTQLFGLGTGLAVLIEAVAVRGVLVPAAMRLLGRAAWHAPRVLRGRTGGSASARAAPRRPPRRRPGRRRQGPRPPRPPRRSGRRAPGTRDGPPARRRTRPTAGRPRHGRARRRSRPREEGRAGGRPTRGRASGRGQHAARVTTS